MNKKKRLLLFLFILICIILTPVLFLLLRQTHPKNAFLTASNHEEVNQFYYRAVPGLQMAEEAGLIREVNMNVDLPGHNAVLSIDRIWYNKKQAIIFYHVEGITQAAYLGGEFYLPSNEPVDKQPYHGSKSIGGDTEKGIIYQDSFYSCLKLPPLKDHSGQILTEIEILTFTPYINLPKQSEQDQIDNIRLKSIDIALNYQQQDETVTKIPVDGQIDIEDRLLRFYQIDFSPSVLKVYFQYLNSGRDQVYRVRGSYTTDKGEIHTFDAFPNAITDYPYHYIMEIPMFHIKPDTIQFQIDSISCLGNDSVSFHLNTNQFSKRNGTHEVEIGRNRIKETEILISKITLNKQYAELLIAFVPSAVESDSIPYLELKPLLPNWSKEGDLSKARANYLTILDSDFQPYDLDEWCYGADILPGEGLQIRLDRKFWEESKSIFIELSNLSYNYNINKAVILALTKEQAEHE